MDRNNHHIKKEIKQMEGTPNVTISYINVDSAQRIRDSTNIYDERLHNLPAYPLQFTHGSSIVTVKLPMHGFKTGDMVAMGNIISKNIILQNVISVKKNSLFVKIRHENHGLSLHGQYHSADSNEFMKADYVEDLPISFGETSNIPDMYENYILKKNNNYNIMIQLSNIKGNNSTRNFVGNIPINYLNRKHRVYLLFTKNNNTYEPDPNNYLIMLEKKSSTNYTDKKHHLGNNVHIKFFNLFGVPLNYLNTGTPVNENMKCPYATIIHTTENSFNIDVGYNAIVDPLRSFYSYNDIDPDLDVNTITRSNCGGGNQVLCRKILETISGHPNPNSYVYNLDRIYTNVVQAKLVGSIFPNSQRIINNQASDIVNNRLYWRNLDDGEHIYYLEIEPGNYSPKQLEQIISEGFSRTLKYQYSQEYQAGLPATLVSYSTPVDNSIYDSSGHNKYHIVDLFISEETDIVSFSSFNEIVQQDANSSEPIIYIPDTFIDLVFPKKLDFCPKKDFLFVYLTEESHPTINTSFPYIYRNLYQYTNTIVGEYYAFLAEINTTRSILMNFIINREVGHREDSRLEIDHNPPDGPPEMISVTNNTNLSQRNVTVTTSTPSQTEIISVTVKTPPIIESVQEINSINTTTLLNNFSYDYLTNIVYKMGHSLKINDLIITDQFINPSYLNQIFVYEIIQIIDHDHFIVQRYEHGAKYKFIYKNLLINFGTQPVVPMEDLSVVGINARPEKKFTMVVYHPNHQLKQNDNIIISNSVPINQVPASAINKPHIINKILDENHYQILLELYSPISIPMDYIPNMVSIKYPSIFQLFFNYKDTLGKILNFPRDGQENSMTPYNHIIRNIDPYIGEDVSTNMKPNKLEMTGYNYFYISCPELGNVHHTKPVANVFSLLRWFDEPGGIVFDSFIQTSRIFNPPIKKLSQLHFSIHHPDGRLVEFNGLDHQFVIEIVESNNELPKL